MNKIVLSMSAVVLLLYGLTACQPSPAADDLPPGPKPNPPADPPGISRAEGFLLYQEDADPDQLLEQPEVVDDVIAVLSTGETGALRTLSYARRTNVEEGSPWETISQYRAKSYASAVRMVRELGVSDPILISASPVDGYLKYHNDRWYAALERALDGQIPGTDLGRTDVAAALLSKMTEAGVTAPQIKAQLEAAQRIAASSRAELQTLWAEDPFQYKPLSFYSGDETLERLWTYDRVLLGIIQGESPSAIAAFNTWLGADRETARPLLALRDVFAKVTNRPDPALFSDDPLSLLHNEGRRRYQCDGKPCGHLWPPSSPGVLERLSAEERARYDDIAVAQPQMQELIERTQRGELSLEPTAEEGFFIYQRYALEALLTFVEHPESAIVSPTDDILKLWEEAFKAGTAKALETHQKVIDIGGGTGIVSEPPPPPELEQLLLDPIPTLYQRYANQYAFLRQFIDTLPDDFVARWRVDGVGIEEVVDNLYRDMLALTVLSSKQLRMAYSPELQAAIDDEGEDALLLRAGRFLKALHTDPALAYDQRFLAVQGRPGGRKIDHCNGKDAVFWGTLGIEAVPITLAGQIDGRNREFIPNMVLLVDHFAELELCVDAPPTREEWRALLRESQTSAEASEKLQQRF